MTSETDILHNCFIYISEFLSQQGLGWSVSNPPKCGASTFTFDTRRINDDVSPLFVIHTWNYLIPQPTLEDLLAIDETAYTNQKKLCYMLISKLEVVKSINQLRLANNEPLLTNGEIISMVPTPFPSKY